jgi:hypothetical protein
MGWKSLEKLLALLTNVGYDKYQMLFRGDIPNLRELNSKVAKKHKLGTIPLFLQ